MTMNKELDKHNKQVARLNHRFKLLISRNDFQEDVAVFRKKWKISINKIKNNVEAQQEWWHQHYKNADHWDRTKWPKYRGELIELEKRALDRDDDEVNYRQYLDRQEAINNMRIINAYYKDLRDILSKYKLPPKWKDAVQAYIFYNEEKYRGLVGITIKTSTGRDNDGVEGDEISVILDAYTTKQDLMDSWPRIKFHLDNLKHKKQDKFQPIDEKIFARNKRIYELRESGKKFQEIAEILNEEDDEKTYGDTDIQSMYRRYKKLLGIN